MKVLSLLFVLGILCTTPVHSFEGKVVNTNPLKVEFTQLKPAKLPAGANGTLSIELSLAAPHHAYLDMFRLTVVSPENAFVGPIKVAPTIEFFDKYSGKKRKGIKKNASITAAFEVPEDLPPGEYKGLLSLRYQACTDDYCLLPKDLPVTFSFEALPPLAKFNQDKFAANNSNIAPHEPSAQGLLNDLLSGQWKEAFFWVFIAGILTSFTPCVFPMIPITLAILGGRPEGNSAKEGFLLSLSYVHGIALTYSILGLIAASTGSLFGALLGHPVAVTVISATFLAMALSLYGFYEIKLPDSWSSALLKHKTNPGYLGAFLTGLIAGVVASPCVGPVLVGILTYVAQTQNKVLGFFLLFTFAMGLGQLFLVLGTFSQLTKKLPRSGPWLNTSKFIFGTTMVAMALYYIEPVTTPRIFSALVALALVLIASYYGAFEPNDKLTSLTKLRKGIMLLAFATGIGFAVYAISPQLIAIYQQKQIGSRGPVGSDQLLPIFGKVQKGPPWQAYSDQLLKESLAAKKPVIIDFYADWCAACVELERHSFPQPEVMSIADKFVWLKLDVGHRSLSELSKSYDIKKYQIVGLPTLVFYNDKGEFRRDLTLTGFEGPKKFSQRIKKLLSDAAIPQ